MKAISKGSTAGCLVLVDAGSTAVWHNKILDFLSMLNNRTLPSWLFDARLSETG